MIMIDGLSPLHQELADRLWQIDDWQEIRAWVAAMPRSVAQQAWVVIQMMLSAELDHMDLGDMEAAREVIDRVRGNHA